LKEDSVVSPRNSFFFLCSSTNCTLHLNHWIPRFVIPGDPTHRVRARLRKPGPVPRPAPGAATGDVGRVLRLLRKHSPMDPRIRRDWSDAERSATPI